MNPNCSSLGREQHSSSVLAKEEFFSAPQSCAHRRSAGDLVVLLFYGHLEHKSNTPHFPLNPEGMGKSRYLLCFSKRNKNKKAPAVSCSKQPSRPAGQASN